MNKLLWVHSRRLDALSKLSFIGRRFKLGRRIYSRGPVRIAIARLLKKNPDLKNAEIWETLAAAPPKGWTFFDNRVGKYVEGPGAGESMSYARFCNVCAEERKAIRAK